MLSIQVLQQGQITDYHATYKYSKDMEQKEVLNWQHVETHYAPIFKELRDKLSLIADQKAKEKPTTQNAKQEVKAPEVQQKVTTNNSKKEPSSGPDKKPLKKVDENSKKPNNKKR